MKKLFNPFTPLIIVGLVLAACGNNTPTTLPPPQPAATPVGNSGLGTPAGPPDPADPLQETTLGDPVALAYNPADSSLLKADNQGLFRWQAGRDWEQVLEAQQPGLSGVAVNPDQPATMYISGPGLGVLRSSDGGDNWQEINSGLPRLDVTALAMHSFRRDTLYAWISNDGIFRTEDGGLSWKKIPDVPIADPQVRGLVHSTLAGSMNTGWLYAATPSGAYLSMD
jgi:predicted small lipoprotein YifL